MNTALIVIGTIGIIAGLAFTVLVGIVVYRKNGEKKRKWDGEGKFTGVRMPFWPIEILLAGFLCIVASQSFKIVPTGYTGVRTTFGLIDQESCMPGFNGLVPFVQKISLVNNKQQDLRFTERVWSETSEQTVVYMENISVTYQILPESSAWIYANVDNWIEQLIDQDIVSSSLKSASRTLTADIVTDRGTIEPLAVQTLQKTVDDKYGTERVIIKSVIINNMDFEDSYNAAIASKSAAMQEQQEQAIRNQTSIEKATADAEAAKIAAQGDAEAERIRAQGKADANKTISDSLTDATQRQDAIEKWNGQLPKYVGSSDAGAATFGIMDSLEERFQ